MSSELDFDDEWSDDEFEPTVQSNKPSKPPQHPKDGPSDNSAQVKNLESELRKAREDVKRLQNLVQEMTFEEEEQTGKKSGEKDERVVLGPGIKGKGKAVLRDDDTHYFDSYEHNGR